MGIMSIRVMKLLLSACGLLRLVKVVHDIRGLVGGSVRTAAYAISTRKNSNQEATRRDPSAPGRNAMDSSQPLLYRVEQVK